MTFYEWEKENWFLIDVKENAKAIWDAATLAEREACAQIVDVKQGVESWEIHGGQETIDVLRDLADKIRMRSNVEAQGRGAGLPAERPTGA